MTQKLYRHTINVSGEPIEIVTHPDECAICYRTAWACHEYPWPNHDFMPRNSSASTLPRHWLSLPITDDTPPTEPAPTTDPLTLQEIQ